VFRFHHSVLNLYPSVDRSRLSSALIRSNALLPLPYQSLGADDFSLHRLALHRVDHLAAEHGALRRLEFHRDVEAVKNPAASRLTAHDSPRKFTRVVADCGHALIACHTVLAEKLIKCVTNCALETGAYIFLSTAQTVSNANTSSCWSCGILLSTQ